jgi:hypothetical protein
VSEEERRRIAVDRCARAFSMPSLFAEVPLQPVARVSDDDDYEGPSNPELDAQLRVSNADLSSVSDEQLESFVFECHRQCLEVNLAYLESEDEKPKVILEKGYILQWVFCVDIVHGRPQSQIPFSFLNCCICAGVDPDTLRGHLLQKEVVRDLLVRLRLVVKLPKLRKKVFYGDIVGWTNPDVGNATVVGDAHHVAPRVLHAALRRSRR